MRTIPLETAGSAAAGADGVATIYLTPVPNWTTWSVQRMSVVCGGSTVPEVTIYRGTISDQNVVDGTNNGRNDTTDTPVQLRSSEQLVARFVGCEVGAVATVTVSGSQQVP